jgi:2-haloalkanoic acid dehalogenase type II
MIKAVVFDLYGTLLADDTQAGGEDKDEAVSRTLREAGYDVYYQEVEAARLAVMFIDYPRGRADTPKEFYAKVLERLEISPDLKLAETLARKAAESEKVRLFEDVVPTVNALKARGIKTAILTTIPIWRFKHALEANSVKIDFICTAKEAGAVKPNPKIYQTVLKTLGVKPNETLMVGDEIRTDVIPPKKLGMKAVMLCREQKKTTKEADHVITSLTQLLQIVQGNKLTF